MMKEDRIPTSGRQRMSFLYVLSATAVLALFVLSTEAQTGEVGPVCVKIKASELSAYTGPNTVGGIVTQGGILNGTSEAVPVSAFFPTANPNTFSFNVAKSFTTGKGVLRTLSPHLLDVGSGIGTAFAYINSETSSGIFAGATGMLFINFKQDLSNGTALADITGEICIAS